MREVAILEILRISPYIQPMSCMFFLQNIGTVTKEEVNEVIDRYEKICEEAFKKAGEEKQIYHKHWLDSPWSGFFEVKDPLKVGAQCRNAISTMYQTIL